jgi:hypothetical protein
MTLSRFHSLSEVESVLKFKPPELVDIALELRNIVGRVTPLATERISFKGLTYYDHERGGPVKGGICGIEVRDKCVRLSFVHGVFLDDPKSLLEGDRLYMRYLEISSFEDASWEDIERLIQTSAKFDCTKLDLSWSSREI